MLIIFHADSIFCFFQKQFIAKSNIIIDVGFACILD